MFTAFVSFLTLFFIRNAIADGSVSHDKSWLNYAKTIESCTPKEFTLSLPNFTFLTSDEKKALHISNTVQEYKIHGFENGKCVVSNKDHLPPGYVSINTQYCTFSKGDLQIVAKFARSLAEASRGKAKILGQEYVLVALGCKGL